MDIIFIIIGIMARVGKNVEYYEFVKFVGGLLCERSLVQMKGKAPIYISM